MKQIYFSIIFCFCLLPVASAQDPAGKWCTQADSSDCLILYPKAPEVLSGTFQQRGQAYAEASGYFRDGKVVMSFRRTNNRDIGFVTFRLRDPKTADAQTFNVDGTRRWAGVYVKQ